LARGTNEIGNPRITSKLFPAAEVAVSLGISIALQSYKLEIGGKDPFH